MSCDIITSDEYKQFMLSLKSVPLEMRTLETLADMLGDFMAEQPKGVESAFFNDLLHEVFIEVIYWRNWPTNEPREVAPDLEPIIDALWNYEVPDLSQLHQVFNKFPVVVKAIGDNEFSVQWHKAKLAEWRATRAESHDEYEEYDDWCETRLFYALHQHSTLYDVFAPRNDAEICVLRVLDASANTVSQNAERKVFVAEAVSVTAESAAESAVTTEEPVVRQMPQMPQMPQKTQKALNVLKFNSVSWKRDDYNPRIHTIELHRQKAGVPRGACAKSATETVRAKLLPELYECYDCSVTLSANPDIICIENMN